MTAVALGATLALLVPAGAHADGILPPLPIGGGQQSPSPSPSPSPSQSPSPSPSPRPKPKPTSSPRPNGPAPAPYRGLRSAVGYVLDIAGTARNTQHLLDLLARLTPAGSAPSLPDLARGFGRFPVVGYVWYHNDYGAPRTNPYFHLHEGVDLFAVAGTPAIASADGVVAKTADGSIGGISVWLNGDDGITYYYGHLQSWAPGIVAGKRVRLGEVLGYVGDTGVAKGTYPHLHFEIHPGGGAPVSPKPVLDAWLTQAETNAVDAYQRIVEFNALTRIGAARWQRVFDLLREPAAPVTALWPLALSPTSSSFGIEAALDEIAWGLDPAGFSSGVALDSMLASSVAEMMTPALLDPPGGLTLAAPR